MNKEKKFNPNFGQGFTDERFGEGAIKVKVTEENFDSIMKNVQVGSTLLLKPNKVTSYGNTHYFTEIVPPYKGETKAKPARKAANTDLD